LPFRLSHPHRWHTVRTVGPDARDEDACDALRAAMAERGTWANIRAMPNRLKTFPFSARVYRQRNAVERFLNKLKHFRAIATRYDKRDDNFLALVQLASIRIWLRTYESVT
jgi:transposase